MPPRLNRAGIPVLDPPGVNHLPKGCRPSQHEWRKVGSQYVETDWYSESDCSRDEYRCRRCGARDSEERWEFD